MAAALETLSREPEALQNSLEKLLEIVSVDGSAHDAGLKWLDSIFTKSPNNKKAWVKALELAKPTLPLFEFAGKVFKLKNNKLPQGVAETIALECVTQNNGDMLVGFLCNTGFGDAIINKDIARYLGGYVQQQLADKPAAATAVALLVSLSIKSAKEVAAPQPAQPQAQQQPKAKGKAKAETKSEAKAPTPTAAPAAAAAPAPTPAAAAAAGVPPGSGLNVNALEFVPSGLKAVQAEELDFNAEIEHALHESKSTEDIPLNLAQLMISKNLDESSLPGLLEHVFDDTAFSPEQQEWIEISTLSSFRQLTGTGQDFDDFVDDDYIDNRYGDLLVSGPERQAAIALIEEMMSNNLPEELITKVLVDKGYVQPIVNPLLLPFMHALGPNPSRTDLQRALDIVSDLNEQGLPDELIEQTLMDQLGSS